MVIWLGVDMSDFDNKIELPPRVKKTILVAFLFISIGVLLFTIGSLFDLTSHLLQTPEIFFTAEHIILYTGVGIMITSAIICLFLFAIKNKFEIVHIHFL